MPRYITAFLLFTSIGFVVYSNTFHVPFHFDDYAWIVEKEEVHVAKFTLEAILRLLSIDRPVAMLSFALNYRIGGLDVAGYHIVNTIIHIFAAFGLFLLLNLSFSRYFGWQKEKCFRASFLAGILWLANPVHTQAVTYIVQRMASMAAMFYVYSIFFYATGRSVYGGKRVAYLVLSAFFASLAIGTKQNAITLPLFIMLYELCIVRKGDIGALRDRCFYVPSLAVAAVLLITTAAIYPEEIRSYLSPYRGMGSVIMERIFTQSRVISTYLSIFFVPLPSRLSIIQNPMRSYSLFDPVSTIFALTFMAALLAYAALSIKKRPLYSFFVFWFLGNHAVEALNLNLAVMYDHRMYLPSMGVAALMGIVLTGPVHEGRRGWIIPLALMPLFFSVNTYLRNAVWNDHISLWRDTVRKSPYSTDAHLGLGLSYMNTGRYEDAIAELKEARGLNPRDPVVRYHLGVAFFEWKLYDMAVSEFRTVWGLGVDSPVGKPTIDSYVLKMARFFLAHGNIEKGRELLGDVKRFHPENSAAMGLLEKLEKGKLTGEDLMPEGW